MSRYKITLVYEDDTNRGDQLTTRATIGVSMVEGVKMIDTGWQLMETRSAHAQRGYKFLQPKPALDWERFFFDEARLLNEAWQAGYGNRLMPECEMTEEIRAAFLAGATKRNKELTTEEAALGESAILEAQEELVKNQAWFDNGVKYATEALQRQAEHLKDEEEARAEEERRNRTQAPPDWPLDVDWNGMFPGIPMSDRNLLAWSWQGIKDQCAAHREEERNAIIDELMVGLRCKSVTLTWLKQGENTGRITDGHGRNYEGAFDAVHRVMKKLEKLHPNRRFLIEVRLRGNIGKRWDDRGKYDEGLA